MTSIIISLLLFVNVDHIDPDKPVERRLKFIGERSNRYQHVGTYHNGQLMYRTFIKKGLLHGSWESWYLNGIRRDSGKIRFNIPEGEWKVWYPNGKLKYRVHFNAVKYHNINNEIDRQPKYRLYKISELPREKAVIHLRSPFSSDLIRQEKLFRKTSFSLEGYEQSLLNDPELYNSPFQNCLLHGEYVSYYENGNVKEQGVFINGLKDGVWEELQPEGLVSRGTYYHGNKSGEWRYYDKEGKPYQLRQYNHQGKLLSQYEFKK